MPFDERPREGGEVSLVVAAWIPVEKEDPHVGLGAPTFVPLADARTRY
jgi:hypothetical protein